MPAHYCRPHRRKRQRCAPLATVITVSYRYGFESTDRRAAATANSSNSLPSAGRDDDDVCAGQSAHVSHRHASPHSVCRRCASACCRRVCSPRALMAFCSAAGTFGPPSHRRSWYCSKLSFIDFTASSAYCTAYWCLQQWADRQAWGERWAAQGHITDHAEHGTNDFANG